MEKIIGDSIKTKILKIFKIIYKNNYKNENNFVEKQVIKIAFYFFINNFLIIEDFMDTLKNNKTKKQSD